MITETTALDEVPPASPEEVRKFLDLLKVVKRKGYGQVAMVVVRGNVVAIKTEIHTKLD